MAINIQFDGVQKFPTGLGGKDVYYPPNEIINLTPHDVKLIFDGPDEPEIMVIPPDPAGPARVNTEQQEVGLGFSREDAYTLPIVKQTIGEVENLPEQKHGTFYIVSRVVAQACPFRYDLLIPCNFERDEEGKILGAKALEVSNYAG